MAIYQGKILTKSPYYITEAVNSGDTSNLEIRIWNGDFNTEPTLPNYTLAKQALGVTTTNVSFEIARLINDSFQHASDIYSITGSSKNEALWVNLKSFGGDTNRNDTFLALDGYTAFNDGINYSPNKILLSDSNIIYHSEGIPLRIPVYCDGTDNANYITFRNGTTEIFTETLISYINSDNSYDKIQYINYNNTVGSIDNIIIKDNSSVTIKTITVLPIQCNKYDQYIISFVNKYGVNEEFPMSMKSKSSIQTTKDSFNRQTLVYNNGVPSYDTGKHVYKEYNVNVKESVTLNTDYIDETLNETMGQLLTSDTVWIRKDGITSPVNMKTNSLQYKTSVNDGLIQYTFDFEYAFDKRNNIY